MLCETIILASLWKAAIFVAVCMSFGFALYWYAYTDKKTAELIKAAAMATVLVVAAAALILAVAKRLLLEWQ